MVRKNYNIIKYILQKKLLMYFFKNYNFINILVLSECIVDYESVLPPNLFVKAFITKTHKEPSYSVVNKQIRSLILGWFGNTKQFYG